LSDGPSFDAIVPLLSQSFRVIVPELPGFRQSRASAETLPTSPIEWRRRDRCRGEDEAIVLGNGYGGFVALQMAIRHPNIAPNSFSPIAVPRSRKRREAFRNMAAASSAKGWQRSPTSRWRRLFAPNFRLIIPSLMARSSRSIPEDRPECSVLPAMRWRA